MDTDYYKIIIARYNEDINWLKEVMNNCIIYNKGAKLNIDNEIILKNVGRESHTYLNYIISNYENLPNIILFSQARISDHIKQNEIELFKELIEEAKIYGKSMPLYSYNTVYKEEFNTWGPDWNFRNCHVINKPYSITKISFKDWFINNIKKNYPDPIHLYCNGIFAVRRDLILKNSKDFYKKLIKQCDYHIDPIEGHFFERSWYYIFS
jgi:hypothetical protein